ncbi:TonB-dependent receptor [Flammeovirga sp. SJP92]|uniref:SusC/RagA family TonB-linked outer membrane protein n=1 Tax=Flammeovirga sp. SJP92 TaxID=1775430 RepID=UPI0007892F1A|nr:TonB-dependent receptor [Flammeovirga sp. SJP92]KXX70804.1 SusC/RagA family TonB-linked outer membrane protein [Flammeovirga sp. SJP92]
MTKVFTAYFLEKSSVLILLFSLILFGFTEVLAQNTISGTVIDQNGEGIPGVTILIKNTTTGTTTDFNGDYRITASSTKDILVFSYIGMISEEVTIGSQNQINITLKEDMIRLDELVVIGYGTQNKKDVTGSVSVVGSEEMESRPNTQVGSLIQGKVAGVQVQASSGKPSQGISMRIRGTNSINAGSEPLYVVDGVPTSDTRSLSPSDIESVSVLKDASAAAIYGAQGANGVVLITTKKGTSTKPSVSLDVYGGVNEVWRTQEVLNGEQYRDLMTEMGYNTDWNDFQNNTDWQNEVFQTGYTQNYQLAISGKSDKTNYYISGGFTGSQGAVRSAEMNRANFKVNLDQEVNNWLKLGSRVSYVDYNDVDVKDNQAVNQGGVLLGALTTPPVIGIYNQDGTFTSNPFQDWENPISSTDGSIRGYNNKRFLGNFYAEVSFLKDFTFKTNLGIDNNTDKYDFFLDPYLTSYGRALNGQSIVSQNNNSYYIFDNTLQYNKEVNKHKIQVLAGSVIQKYHWQGSNIERRNFASDAVTTPNGGSEIASATAYESEKANASFIGRVNYAFNNKYLLTANVRVDGSSVFGPRNRWGIFPSFSAGWRVSEEAFLKNVEAISDLKLRAGYGIVGNDNIGTYAYMGKVGIGSNYPIGGVTQPGSYPASIENQKLKWEESEQTNIGIDLGLLHDRIELTADAYIKRTSDLLLNAPLPRSTGYDNAIQNIGALENRGIEFNLNTVNYDKAIKWTTNFNISFNRNKVTNLVGQEIYTGSIAGRGEAIQIKEGQPLGAIYGYEFLGVDPQTGNAYYMGADGNSTFDPTPDDRKVIGDANPDFIYGFTNTVMWKGFTLSVFFQGAQGSDMLNATRIDTEGMTDAKNQSSAVLNRWKRPGDQTDIPKSSPGNTDNSRISTRFVEDASYLRLKALTVSYTLPETITNKLSMGSARFYVTGENLWTLTNYSGFDPEVNQGGNSNTVLGIDYGTYPQTRSVIIGANITF